MTEGRWDVMVNAPSWSFLPIIFARNRKSISPLVGELLSSKERQNGQMDGEEF